MATNAGYSFLGTVISAGILGFIIDKVFETQPWGFIAFMIIGLAYAVFLAQRTLDNPTENSDVSPPKMEPDKKDDEKL